MGENDIITRYIIDGDATGITAAMEKGKAAVQSGADQISGAFNKMGGSINGAIGIVGTLGAVLAGGAAFKSIISETVNWDLEVGKLSKTLGVTTEDASVFKVALHSVGIEQDIASAAALRMAKTMNSNSDAFKAIGVDIDGMKKAGKSNIDMMMATVTALGEYKGGLDRNQVAMTIFGRSWGELQQLMKLTPLTMREAQEAAERLHLIVGPEGIEKAREYKKALAELDLVKISLTHTAGVELIGALTEVAALMQGPAVKSAHIFALGIHEVHDAIHDTLIAVEDMDAKIQRKIDMKAVNTLTLFMAARAAMTGHYDMIPTILGVGYQAGKNLRHNDLDMSDMTMAGVQDPDKGTKTVNTGGGPLTKKAEGSGGLTTDKLLTWMNGYWAMVDEREFETALADSAGFGFKLAESRATDLSWQPRKQKFSLMGADSAGWGQNNETSAEEVQAAERYAALEKSLMSENELMDREYMDRRQVVDDAHRWGLLAEQEYGNTLLQLQGDYDKRRATADIAAKQQEQQREQRLTDSKVNMYMAAGQAGVGIIQMFAGKNKALGLASIALQKGMNIATTLMSAKTGSMLAYSSQLIPGDPSSIARAELARDYTLSTGAITAALIAAQGIGEAVQSMSGGSSGGGSYSSGSYGSTPVTQSVSNATPAPSQVTVQILGDIIGEETWVQNKLIPAINDALNRNHTLNM
jgi:NTP pyrophosphatase (non-canonical NTP hydrolase)